jgi:hypothetical protein
VSIWIRKYKGSGPWAFYDDHYFFAIDYKNAVGNGWKPDSFCEATYCGGKRVSERYCEWHLKHGIF